MTNYNFALNILIYDFHKRNLILIQFGLYIFLIKLDGLELYEFNLLLILLN